MAEPNFAVPDFNEGSTAIFGFDELEKDLDGTPVFYQMVPAGGERTLHIATEGRRCVVFSRAPSVAIISAVQANTPFRANDIIQLSGKNKIERLFVQGTKKEGKTEIIIADANTFKVTARLIVSVKRSIDLSVRFFSLEDSVRKLAIEKRLIPVQRAIDRVKLIFKNQANISLVQNISSIDAFSIDGNVSIDRIAVLGGKIQTFPLIVLEDKMFQINGIQNQSVFDHIGGRFKNTTVRFNVVFTWTIRQSLSIAKAIGGLTNVGGNFSVVDPNVADDRFLTSRIAHEMTHAIGEPDEPVLLRHLMSANENLTWRMRQRNIDAANPTGLNVVIDPGF